MATIIVTYLVTAVVPKFAVLYRDLGVELAGVHEAADGHDSGLPLRGAGHHRDYICGGNRRISWSRTEEGGAAFDRFKFKLPVIGDTLLKFQVAQFSRTLATLLTGGTTLVTALQTASDALTSKLLRSTILRATQMVREGESLHGALASRRVMPDMALDMIEVGECSGALGRC